MSLFFQKVKQLSAVPSKGQTSEEWLKNHSIEYEKLTLKDMLQRGKQVRLANVICGWFHEAGQLYANDLS